LVTRRRSDRILSTAKRKTVVAVARAADQDGVGVGRTRERCESQQNESNRRDSGHTTLPGDRGRRSDWRPTEESPAFTSWEAGTSSLPARLHTEGADGPRGDSPLQT